MSVPGVGDTQTQCWGIKRLAGRKAMPRERVRRSSMRRLWMSLLLVPVMVVAVASAAWASPAAPAARAQAAALLTSGRALQPGMTGAKVKALQQRLAALKYYPG